MADDSPTHAFDPAGAPSQLNVTTNRTTTVRLVGPKEALHVPFGPAAFTDQGELAPLGLSGLAVALGQVTPRRKLLVAGHGPDPARAQARADAVLAALRTGAGLTEAARGVVAGLIGGPAAVDEARGQLQLAAPGAHGCGDAWTPDKVRLGAGYRAPAAERVDVLLFAAEEAPKLDCHQGGACEPKTCDVYRKQKYRAITLPVEPPPPGKTVHVAEVPLPDAFLAAAGKAKDGVLFQPGPLGGEGGLQAVAAALKLAGEGAAQRVAVALHGASPNAAERAASLLAFVRGRDAWVEHARKKATVGDWQRLLKWLAAARGWACDPGPVDDLPWGGTQKALEAFRKGWKAEAKVTLPPGQGVTKDDWRALFDALDQRVGQLAGGDPTALRAKLTALEAVDCSTSWPTAGVEVHHWLGPRDDRVELLLFSAADAPGSTGGQLEEVYGGRRYRAHHLLLGDAHRLAVRVVDASNKPLGGGRFEVRRGETVVREGELGPDAVVEAVLPEGSYQVRVLGAPPATAPAEAPAQEATLEELLRGDWQRKGTYKADLSGFVDPGLQRLLEQACAAAGCDPGALTPESGASGAVGDSEQGVSKGLPEWLRVFQLKAATAKSWSTQEQTWSRLLGAFYVWFFVDRFYAKAGVALPSNVEYLLEHLGMSTGNGAAQPGNVGAGAGKTIDFAYCASASSKAFLRGLARYGWKTSATGFAPGGPGQGHGCKVGFSQGRLAGDANRPRPGDVLSVKTAIGPESGHVVTVVWAETDGTKSGTMWYVSGNAMNRSVSCDFVRVVDQPGRPPRGAVSVINRCYDHELQPDRLAAMSPAELTAKKVQKVDAAAPPPNAPGQATPGGAAAPRELLLAAGDFATSPASAPAAAGVLRVALAIVSFTGKAGPAEPGRQLLLEPGGSLRLAWEATAFERLVLEPLGRDVTEQTLAGQPFLEVSPAEQPPDERGCYRLVATTGAGEVTADVEVRGILDFRITGRPVDALSKQKSKKNAEVLRRVMTGGHPRFGSPFYEQADSLGAKAGSFRALDPKEEDYEFWYWGQLTPRSDALLSWKVIWPGEPRLRLTINRAPGKYAAEPSLEPTSQREGAALVGRHEHFAQDVYRTFFEADLEVLDGEQVVQSAVLRLRENYEMPGIEDFWLEVDGREVRDGSNLEVAPGKRPIGRWRLKGSHARNGLELKLVDAAGGLVIAEVMRPRPQDGEATPEGHKRDEGSRQLATPLPKGRLEVEARLELQNIKGRVDSKRVRFVIPGPAHAVPETLDDVPDEVKIALFDPDHERMRGARWRLTMGTYVREGTAPAGEVLFKVKELPRAQVTRRFKLEWGQVVAGEGDGGFLYERELFLGYDQGSTDDKAAQRLHNLGYDIDEPLERSLRLFQRRVGLPITGKADATTLKELEREHDGHAPKQLAQPPAPEPNMAGLR